MPASTDAFRGPDCDYCNQPTLVSEYAAVDVRLCLSGGRERRQHLTFCSQDHLTLYFQEHRLLDLEAAGEASAADLRTATWVFGSCLVWLLLAVAAVAVVGGLGYLLVTRVV